MTELLIKSEPGDIINPDDIRMIEGEGMPQHKKPFEKGNLYIHFTLVFPPPKFFNDKQLKQLEEILPPRKPYPKETPDMEVVDLKKASEQQRKPGQQQQRGESYEEDEEPQGNRVQCAQQ